LNEAEQVPYIVDSLTTAGCPNVAAITADAIAVLDPQPGWSAEDISNAAADMEESDDERLSALDPKVYEYPDPIPDRLFAGIAEPRDEIVLPKQAPPSPSGTQVVGTRAVGAVRTGILRIADTLVDMGNVAVDGGFIETPDGWRCRMRDPIDFGVLKTMFQ